ncbi:MAG: hypothetical protein Q9217_000502 [Psora testacea]
MSSEMFRVLTFEIEATAAICGESNVRLNGQSLQTEWNGVKGNGNGFLDAYNAEFYFNISCLSPFMSPADPTYHNGKDGIHVLSFQLNNPEARPNVPGFTISYKQTKHPSIIRFQPSYVGTQGDNQRVAQWKTASAPFVADGQPSSDEAFPAATIGSLYEEQKSLSPHINRIKATLKDKIHKLKANACKAVEILRKACPKHSPSVNEAKSSYHKVIDFPQITNLPSGDAMSSSHLVGHSQTLESDTIESEISSPVHHSLAAESLSVDAPIGTASPASIFHHHNGTPSNIVLKSFAVALMPLSFFAWLFLRFRDPRRRADRAARREERRNKRLYRRAARHQAIKNWFWSLRMKYHLAIPSVLRWDEKRTRVTTQDKILENVMKDDIRDLCNAHSVVSSLTASAAEEGRTSFVYTSDGEQRRPRSIRSVSTLPGYESEGSQPPPYDVMNFSAGEIAEEFTPDSSVVSTSPRISRDGTNSEFEEKIEVLDLGERGMGRLVF